VSFVEEIKAYSQSVSRRTLPSLFFLRLAHNVPSEAIPTKCYFLVNNPGNHLQTTTECKSDIYEAHLLSEQVRCTIL